jgi:hypothetical protein
MHFLQRRLWLDQGHAIDAGLAMNVFCGQQLPANRPVRTRIHFHIGTACNVANLPDILFRKAQGHVAGHRCDTENIQFIGRGHRQQQAYRIVLPGITVHDDRPFRHRVSL